MANSDAYYAHRLYTIAMSAPEVNATDEAEVLEYVRDLARDCCLNPDTMEKLCRKHFVPTDTNDLAAGTEYEVSVR